MNALLARQRCPCSAETRQRSPARNQDHLAVASTRMRVAKRNAAVTTAVFRTMLGGGGETKTHDGSNPLVLQAGSGGGAASLRLEERAGRVYATAELEKKGGGGSDEDDDLLSFGPPPPSGVFLSGAELRPGTSYLLSPGAEISFTDAATGKETSVTVDYEVSDSDGIGGLGEMLARAMAAQASDDVRAKLDDVF